MAIHNTEIAAIFSKVANLLDIKGENPFRIRAYRNAARVIYGQSKSIAKMIEDNDDLTLLPGIGKDLAGKIKTIVQTGQLPLLTQMEKRLPPVLNELMQIEGLGPRRIQIIYRKLKVKTSADLKLAIEKGRLQKMKGFGDKIAQKILRGIEHVSQYSKRIKLADAFPIVDSIIHYLKQEKNISKVECAGSFRRRKETVGDLDILATGKNPEKIIQHFVEFDEVENILSKGSTRSTVRLRSGIQVDLRVVAAKSYGAALLYFTGSKEHNIAIRRIALEKKLKINEYGVFKKTKQIAGQTETESYRQVGLPYIDPELREDRGEIAAAKKNQLPKLITLNDIRGDLHCHTNATDGEATLEAMARAAEQLGYEYIAITDHTKHLAMVHGLDKKRLMAQIKLIDKLNAKLKKIVILKSIEIDILENGSLDLPNEILKELDLTVCSIHSKFNLPLNKQMQRIYRAMDNPYFTILGHPIGRLINRREAYQIDMEKIIIAAKERGCCLELNAQPDRLDLDDIHCKIAKESGVKIAISSDAHSLAQLNYMSFGVFQARRGWLSASNVINTLSLSELCKMLKR
ncbi:MAG: hypothetical protein ACD_46C00611G0005 [uncultured bacterium]|nr:MAG: hypothetical protein ACD_46C00611G0005 [uncultured bacterium]